MGGALRSEHWRLKVDLLLITIATNACKGGWADDERVISLPSDATSTQADFQLAALRALLASLLSPARVRPPYLAQGLELFRRGSAVPDSNFSMPPFFKTASATNWSFPHKKASLMNVILWSRGLEGDWEVVGFFNSKISFAVGNGSRVKFWKDSGSELHGQIVKEEEDRVVCKRDSKGEFLHLGGLLGKGFDFGSTSKKRVEVGQQLVFSMFGKQETGTRLAEFCTHALLALEVLIHPRALPLEDFPTVNRKSFDNGANNKYPENYDLYDKWLGSDDEIDIPVTDPSKNRNNVDDASEAFRDHQTEKLPSVDGASSPKVAKKIDHRSAATGADMREGGTEEEIMVESHQFPESISQEESTFPAVISASTSTKIEIGKVASDSGALDPGDSEIATGNDVLVAKGDSFAIQGENASTAVSNSERSKGLVSELDNESSMDSFPDIVDADPDSDSE
ncbi:hypothetical protein CK203_067166 [Vitis vinifera]|uniref:Uncharacterized protein n=1 Tax=Vitis vinifera TaxID=29760 RepID=A0A438EFV1_VITVI|nr:hypothetical protein CK203_067166 [Vitis vinifera]